MKLVSLKRTGTSIAVVLLCGSFFAFLRMEWTLSLVLMFVACAIGIFCGED